MVQESRSLTRLVDNLLAVSRITDVTEIYSFEPQALDALVDDTLKGFEPQLDAADFETIVEDAGGPAARQGRPHRDGAAARQSD